MTRGGPVDFYYDHPEALRRGMTYRADGHDGGVCEDRDWGGPSEWQAFCSNHWQGTVFGQMLRTDGSNVLGTAEDALRELLVHVGFDPAAHRAATDQQVTDLLTEISQRLATVEALRARTATLIAAFTKEN